MGIANHNRDEEPTGAGEFFEKQNKTIDIKDIEPNSIYKIEYQWGDERAPGWGRYNPETHSQVDIICGDGGVRYAPVDTVTFIEKL